jgi:hypothetical protein
MRIALGAGRGRLLRQLLTESVLLSGLGGIFALGIAWAASPLLVQAMSRGRTPISLDPGLNWRTPAFTAAVSLIVWDRASTPSNQANGQDKCAARSTSQDWFATLVRGDDRRSSGRVCDCALFRWSLARELTQASADRCGLLERSHSPGGHSSSVERLPRAAIRLVLPRTVQSSERPSRSRVCNAFGTAASRRPRYYT